MSILPPPPRIFCKYADNYCVTSQKLVLDVQKARLRVIFVRALYLPRLFAKKIITNGKQHNFFANKRLSHKTRKKIFRSVCFLYRQVLRIGTRQSKKQKTKPLTLKKMGFLGAKPLSRTFLFSGS